MTPFHNLQPPVPTFINSQQDYSPLFFQTGLKNYLEAIACSLKISHMCQSSKGYFTYRMDDRSSIRAKADTLPSAVVSTKGTKVQRLFFDHNLVV